MKTSRVAKKYFFYSSCIMHKQVSWHHHGQIINSEMKGTQTEKIAF